MAKCPANTRDGRACKGVVQPGETFCVAHDPERRDERKRNASRAGQSRGTKEIQTLKKQISAIAEGVLSGEVERGRGAVALQGLNALRGALELERRTRLLEKEFIPLEQILTRDKAFIDALKEVCSEAQLREFRGKLAARLRIEQT